MALNTKDYDGNLFDQKTIIERLDRAYKDGRFEEERDIIMSEIDRKLYNDPPIYKEG